MNNRAGERTADETITVPRQSAHQGSPPGAPGETAPQQDQPESRRANVRDALDAALSGAALSSRDRQFLSRLVKWDKRNAASVVSLLWRARLAGRAEALTQRQMEVVLGALSDAAAYRNSGAESLGCWDCENFPGSRCSEHAKDLDRARACSELASELAAGRASPELPQPSDIAGYRHCATVAS